MGLQHIKVLKWHCFSPGFHWCCLIIAFSLHLILCKNLLTHQNNNVIIYIYCTMMMHIQHPASNIHHTNVSVCDMVQFKMVSVPCAPPHQSEVSPLLDGICALRSTPSLRSFPIVGWYLCAALHPISQKFPHCWMVSLHCAPPHQSEVSPLLDGICALRSTPSLRSFPIVGWYLCAALHPISQKFPHCWMVSMCCAPPHQSEVSPLLDGVCALRSTPSVRSFPIVGWYLCAALHPISQKFPHCWVVSVHCAPPHQSEVSPLLDGVCALRSTPSLRSFPIVGWYLCAALHPISQKFPHCWMVSVRCAPPHQSEVSPLLDGICALRSTPSLRSFLIVGWYLCAALHPISQKFPHCWMVSVRCTPPHQSEVSPLLDGICEQRSTPSLRSFPIVGWYLCAALHPISQKFPHCWMVSVRCAPPHLSEVSPLLDGICALRSTPSEVSPLLDGICALRSTPSVRSFPIVGWYLCAALHPISQKFPHCWMVSVHCAPPHQSEVSPLLDGICVLRSTPSLRSFLIVGWYLCAALHPISQKFPHCWMVSVRCAPPHVSEVSPLLDGICALRSTPSVRSFPIVGWYLCAALHPISQKFPHCWMVSVHCAPPHLSEVSPLLDGICALRSTPSLRSFPIVGWYLCAALHPISQKFPHCWMVSVHCAPHHQSEVSPLLDGICVLRSTPSLRSFLIVGWYLRCAPPHQSEVSPLLDGICALRSTPSLRSFPIVGWYLCAALHPISQKFPHCWMVSVRCAPPHQSEVSPLLDGICALCSTPSLRSFPIVGWYLCTALHPISQKFPHCWMVSVRCAPPHQKFPHCWMVSVHCAPPHQSEVSPLLDGICALRSTPSLRSFPIVGWYLCAALHPISQKFPHCWMVSVRCAPPHQLEVSPLLDGICALRSTPSVRSFPIVGWYLCAAFHPISQKFPHCWVVSVRCAPPHLSEVSPLLDGICALRSTPSLRSFPIVGWYLCAALHPISQKFLHCWMVSVRCAPPHLSEVSPLLDGICALRSTPSVWSFPVVGWYLCTALHPISQKFPHCWMVSVRCAPPHQSEVSPLLDGICALRSTPSLKSFPIVAFETVLMFVSLMMALSCPFKEDCLALPLSTPLTYSVYI